MSYPNQPGSAEPGRPPMPITLKAVDTSGATRMLMIPLAVLLFLVGALLFSSILGGLGAPVPLLLGVVVSAVFTAGMWVWKGRQLAGMSAKTSLMLSEAGMRREDTLVVSEMPWSALTGFTRSDTLAKGYHHAPISDSMLAQGGSAAVDAAGSRKRMQVSLLGGGTLRRKPGLSALWVKSVEQNYGITDDQVHQRDRLILTPEHFEPEWRTGSIGQFLRYYRPDLVIPASDDDVIPI